MVLHECFSLALLFTTLNITNVSIPAVKMGTTTVPVNNVEFSHIGLHNSYLGMNSTHLGVFVGDDTVVDGNFTVSLLSVTYDVRWLLTWGGIVFFHGQTDTCIADTLGLSANLAGSVFANAWTLTQPVTDTEPPALEYGTGLSMTPAEFDSLVNFLGGTITLDMVSNPLNDFLPVVNGARSLNDTIMFPAALKAIANLPEVFGLRLEAMLPTENGFSLNISMPAGGNFTTPSISFSSPLGFVEAVLALPQVRALINQLKGFLGGGGLLQSSPASLSLIAKALQQVELTISSFVVENMSLSVDLPAESSVQVDIAFNDLQCDASGYVCTVQPENGIEVVNVRTSTNGYIDPLLANMIGPKLLNITNGALNGITNKSYPDRMTIPMWSKP